MPRIYRRLIAEFLTSAREHDLAELRLLLAAHPILINALDQQGQNALSVAGSGDAAEFLVENGAVDPDAARQAAGNAFKHYVAAGDVYRLVELVRFYTVDLDEVERDSGGRTRRCFTWRCRIQRQLNICLIGFPLGVSPTARNRNRNDANRALPQSRRSRGGG